MLDGDAVAGYYYLWIIDSRPLPKKNPGYLTQWSLVITKQPALDSADVLVNTATQGNQFDPAISMDHLGNFIITWCGYGEQPTEPDQQDTSGSGGVFYQRFDAAGIPLYGNANETFDMRVNPDSLVPGDQVLPSVAMDAGGDFVISYYDDYDPASPATPISSIWSYLSRANPSATFLLLNPNSSGTSEAAPEVAEVFEKDGTRVLDGSVLPTGLDSLVVAFDQCMSLDVDPTNQTEPATNSVLNLENWSLTCNGQATLRQHYDGHVWTRGDP